MEDTRYPAAFDTAAAFLREKGDPLMSSWTEQEPVTLLSGTTLPPETEPRVMSATLAIFGLILAPEQHSASTCIALSIAQARMRPRKM